jgi:hypothetical protein
MNTQELESSIKWAIDEKIFLQIQLKDCFDLERTKKLNSFIEGIEGELKIMYKKLHEIKGTLPIEFRKG